MDSHNQIQKAAKSFFQRPEGKTGAVFIGLAMIAAAYGLNLILPFLITLATNTLTLMVLCAAIAAMFVVVTDKRFRTLMSYMFKASMRWVTGLVIEIDPIGILKVYADNLRSRLEEMEKSISALRGQKNRLAEIIRKNEEEREHSLLKAKKAHETGKKAALSLMSRQAGRLQKSNLTLQALHNKMEAMLKALMKMHEVSQYLIQDIEGEIRVKSAERAAILASHSAFTAAKKIIQGDQDQKAMFDQAMEFLAEDYANKIGEIENFIEMSTGFIQSVDLENGVYEQAALDQFDAWEKKADTLLLGPGEKNHLFALDATPKVGVGISRTATTEGSGTFSDLFDK